MGINYEDIKNRLKKATGNAVSITWDMTSKVYILTSFQAHSQMDQRGYKLLAIGKGFSREDAANQLLDWFKLCSRPSRSIRALNVEDDVESYTDIVSPFEYLKPKPKSCSQSMAERMTELEDQILGSKVEGLLDVNLAAEGVIGDIAVSAYLTDEGLACDVFRGDECIASGYKLFSDVGLEPPQPMEY